MKVSIIGGGAWGTTLAQLLNDNGNDVLIEDINQKFVDDINNLHIHPAFNIAISDKIKATTSLSEALDYSDVIVLCIPTKYVRSELEKINNLINTKKLFINVSKGIEPETSKRISELVYEIISKDKLKGYVVLSGPSHAEEVILRKVTSLVCASYEEENALFVQNLFNNPKYLRTYRLDDVIGVEVGGAMKNAIAIVSGVSTGLGLGENARAFLISRGIKEILSIAVALGADMQTIYGLSGVGDLIVTASSMNSRNFKCGLEIGRGKSIDEAIGSINQVVEGIRAIEAGYEIGLKYKLDLPIFNVAHKVINKEIEVTKALELLLNRDLKSEKYW